MRASQSWRPHPPAVAALLLLAFCVCTAAAAAGLAPTRLTIRVFPAGRQGGIVRRYTLRCGPAAGTVARPLVACERLMTIRQPFAPVPAGTICSQVALGDEEAIVTGMLRGRRMWVRLSLLDSCEIERWRRVRAVVPGFPARN